MIYRIWGEHANYYTTDVVSKMINFYCPKLSIAQADFISTCDSFYYGWILLLIFSKNKSFSCKNDDCIK